MTTAVRDEQFTVLPTAALAYKRVTFVNEMDSTSGTVIPGMSNPDVLVPWISTWRPTLQNGWYYLGQGASTFTLPLARERPSGVIVHALEDDALKDVASWERVWAHEGADKSRDYALWRGVPPSSDYVVIGGILSSSADFAPPDSAQTHGIKAIRKDLLIMDGTHKVWDDVGFGSRNEASVWLTDGNAGIATGAMIPMPSYRQPPEDMGLNLYPAKVLEITSNSSAEGDASADT